MEEKLWYVVNTYSGHEEKVKENLLMRTESMGMQNNIFQVIVPKQNVTEINKEGKEITKEKKMFPGYILVQMIMSDEAWFIVRNTPGVTGFIGSSGKGAKPTPLQPYEVEGLVGKEMPTVKPNEWNPGDEIEIIDGPFVGMFGKIESIDLDNNMVNALVDLFGQETPVELELGTFNRK